MYLVPVRVLYFRTCSTVLGTVAVLYTLTVWFEHGTTGTSTIVSGTVAGIGTCRMYRVRLVIKVLVQLMDY